MGSCVGAGNAGLQRKVHIVWLLGIKSQKSMYLARELRTNEKEGQKLSPVLPVLPVGYKLFSLSVQSERRRW